MDQPCLKIWRTAMPIGTNCKGGLMMEELNVGDDNAATYREDLARSNLNLKPILKEKGFWFFTFFKLFPKNVIKIRVGYFGCSILVPSSSRRTSGRRRNPLECIIP